MKDVYHLAHRDLALLKFAFDEESEYLKIRTGIENKKAFKSITEEQLVEIMKSNGIEGIRDLQAQMYSLAKHYWANLDKEKVKKLLGINVINWKEIGTEEELFKVIDSTDFKTRKEVGLFKRKMKVCLILKVDLFEAGARRLEERYPNPTRKIKPNGKFCEKEFAELIGLCRENNVQTIVELRKLPKGLKYYAHLLARNELHRLPFEIDPHKNRRRPLLSIKEATDMVIKEGFSYEQIIEGGGKAGQRIRNYILCYMEERDRFGSPELYLMVLVGLWLHSRDEVGSSLRDLTPRKVKTEGFFKAVLNGFGVKDEDDLRRNHPKLASYIRNHVRIANLFEKSEG